MNDPIVFRHVAKIEYDQAADWYEERSAGLGVVFATAIQHILDRIAKQADFYPRVLEQVREALVPSFPYCIYYVEEERRIVVLSVFHTSRDPMIWQNRA